jgi:hypothetical protein
MGITRKDEERRLSGAERGVVERTHHPAICRLDVDELHGLRKVVREYRRKARDEARRQRRELRGKADPRGMRPAGDDGGMAFKVQIFAGALKRLNREIERLSRPPERRSQADLARAALRMKQAAAGDPHHPLPDHRRNAGMVPKDSDRPTVTPDRAEIGRVSQFVRDAQVARDRG